VIGSHEATTAVDLGGNEVAEGLVRSEGVVMTSDIPEGPGAGVGKDVSASIYLVATAFLCFFLFGP